MACIVRDFHSRMLSFQILNNTVYKQVASLQFFPKNRLSNNGLLCVLYEIFIVVYSKVSIGSRQISGKGSWPYISRPLEAQ